MDLPVESPLDQILSQLIPSIPSRKVLFWGDGAGDLSSYLAGWMAGQGTDIIVLDGANRFDPYMVSSLAKKAWFSPEKLLKKIRIARAFTCYQMATMIGERLPSLLGQGTTTAQSQCPRVIISGPITTFLDEDVPERESRLLFERMLRKMEEMAGEGVSFYLFQPNSPSSPFTNTNEINGFTKNRRVRSPKAPYRGVIRDHALQSRKNKKYVCIKRGLGGLADSRETYLTRRLLHFSDMVWRTCLDEEEPKMILEKSLAESHETKDLRLRLGSRFSLE